MDAGREWEREESVRAWRYQRDVQFGKAILLWILIGIAWGAVVNDEAAYVYMAIGFTINLFTGMRFGRAFSDLRHPFQALAHVAGLALFTWIVPPLGGS